MHCSEEALFRADTKGTDQKETLPASRGPRLVTKCVKILQTLDRRKSTKVSLIGEPKEKHRSTLSTILALFRFFLFDLLSGLPEQCSRTLLNTQVLLPQYTVQFGM